MNYELLDMTESGIQVLSENVNNQTSIGAGIVTSIMAIVLLIFAIVLIKGKEVDGLMFGIWAIFLICVTIFCFKPNPRTEYQVLLPDEIGYFEVVDNFEVVDVDGVVYTIVEKEKEE